MLSTVILSHGSADGPGDCREMFGVCLFSPNFGDAGRSRSETTPFVWFFAAVHQAEYIDADPATTVNTKNPIQMKGCRRWSEQNSHQWPTRRHRRRVRVSPKHRRPIGLQPFAVTDKIDCPMRYTLTPREAELGTGFSSTSATRIARFYDKEAERLEERLTRD